MDKAYLLEIYLNGNILPEGSFYYEEYKDALRYFDMYSGMPSRRNRKKLELWERNGLDYTLLYTAEIPIKK